MSVFDFIHPSFNRSQVNKCYFPDKYWLIVAVKSSSPSPHGNLKVLTGLQLEVEFLAYCAVLM